MSYCRFSSDDFNCDVYVYPCDGGYRTHVAGRRHVFERPAFPENATPDQWIAHHMAVMAAIKDAPLVDIGLPFDGESYTDTDPGSCADRLEQLRAAGYNVPQYAIDELREEAATESIDQVAP